MMVFHIRPEVLEHLREEYPVGCEVELIEMCDPYREMPTGMIGKVMHVDDAGGIHVAWSNGSTLAAIDASTNHRRIDNMPENKKPQTGKAFLKTYTTEEIADLISSGHPPFQEEVHCDTTSCRDCWLA